MIKQEISIIWFRKDLRLSDNLALKEAAKSSKVLAIYILDTSTSNSKKLGSASKVWLHESLKNLNSRLDNKLNFYRGKPIEILQELISQYHVANLYWNRCYEPWIIKRDAAIKEKLKQQQIHINSYNSALLWEPWEIKKADGQPYKVFTPFYRKGCLNAANPRKPIKAPALTLIKDKKIAIKLDDLNLIPNEKWISKIQNSWQIGEAEAQKKLNKFIKEKLQFYKEGRNYPDKNYISKLSPHLHFGEISPHQVWNKTNIESADANSDHFCSELGWREFSYSQMFFNPKIHQENIQKKFDKFPWIKNQKHFNAWKKGVTGIPIVDAGMRELWATGFIHNRVRMIVGSFLVKNLMIDWRAGENWFWDCLVDADLANNSASWQWVAGCGADAAPYFRIFNPVTQGQKFDQEGIYTKKWVPELATMPIKFLFNPWEASEAILSQANIKLGKNYPKPIVDIKQSREQALAAFSKLKTT